MDAERLLLHVLKRSETSWLYAHDDTELERTQRANLHDVTDQRATGKPLAYILGEWEFYGRPFFVNESVLIPRPSTEDLIDAALSAISRLAGSRPLVVADIGTGSGCIAITLILESRSRNPHSAGALRGKRELRVIATDISEAALAVARQNAKRHGVLDQIEFLHGDMLVPFDPASWRAQGKPQVDLLVSNPPYVPTAELADAPNNPATFGLAFEPQVALDGGADGHQYLSIIKNSGIPAVVETQHGRVVHYGPLHMSPASASSMPAKMRSSNAARTGRPR